MGEPVAWCYQSYNPYIRTIYYHDPSEFESVPEGDPILLYEGWEERLEAYESSLEPGWMSTIVADGEYDKYYIGVPAEEEEPKDRVSILADNIRSGINTI